MKHSIIYRQTEGPFRYQAWPTVCRNENGVLFAVCSGHRVAHICPFGKNLMFVSHDDGETWTPPIIINDTYMDNRDAGLCCFGNGKMILTYFSHPFEDYLTKWRSAIEKGADEYSRDMTMAMLNSYEKVPKEYNQYGSFIRITENGGLTWSRSYKIPVSSPHGPIQTKSKRLLHLGKEFHYWKEREKQIILTESMDGGKTWEYVSTIDTPEGLGLHQVHEPHLTELPDGKLLAGIRAQGDSVYHRFSMYFCTSDDGGLTWAKPMPSQISGSPPHLLVLSDGKVLCTYIHRQAERQGLQASAVYTFIPFS